MSKYKKLVLVLGFLATGMLLASSQHVKADGTYVDKNLHNHAKQLLGKHQRLNIVAESVSEKSPSIKVFLPVPKKSLQPKTLWPARKNIDCAQQKCIALTFDDGPSIYTPELLDILNRKSAKATFFVVGSRVAGSENVLQRMLADGHEIGNHSFSHTDLRSINAVQIDNEIIQTQSAVTGATGYTPHIFRPPYGALPPNQAGQLTQLPVILWNNDPEDWERHTHDITAAHVGAQAMPGGVVLMHDLYPETINAIPVMIDGLRAQGYELVTVTELMGWKSEAQLPKGQIIKNR